MDLLFHRYANPFLLLDGWLQIGRFFEFVLEFLRMDDERTLWEFFLHKIAGRTYVEFKESLRPKPVMTKQTMNNIVQESAAILNGFRPE